MLFRSKPLGKPINFDDRPNPYEKSLILFCYQIFSLSRTALKAKTISQNKLFAIKFYDVALISYF